jgi:hypothetical protein
MDVVQCNKYTAANIDHYVSYVMNVPSFNRRRFKYLDEASFHSLSLRKRYGRAPAGKPLILKDPVYEVSTFNITLVCALRFQ